MPRLPMFALSLIPASPPSQFPGARPACCCGIAGPVAGTRPRACRPFPRCVANQPDRADASRDDNFSLVAVGVRPQQRDCLVSAHVSVPEVRVGPNGGRVKRPSIARPNSRPVKLPRFDPVDSTLFGGRGTDASYGRRRIIPADVDVSIMLSIISIR